MAKPPYITFLLIPLIMSYGKNTAAALRALGLSLFAILLWSGLGLIPVLAATSSDPHVSAAGQIHNLLQHPFYIFAVLWNTFRLGYYGQAGDYMARTCIATLAWGWMAEQGRWFCWLFFGTGGVLSVFYAYEIVKKANTDEKIRSLLTGLMIAGGAVGATVATYLTWTPVGQNWAYGTNGRYFIAPVILLSVAGAWIQFSDAEERRSVIVQRSLLCTLLPLSAGYFAYTVFMRFWWPV